MQKLGTFFFCILFLIFVTVDTQAAEQTASFLMTTNLNGQFTTVAQNQHAEDPLLLMAQSLIEEQQNKTSDLFIDLGNAFYPGLLSRFSVGSIMMDYLDYFGCYATLVSSQDLKIGINNLEFIAQNKRTKLLSANVEKNKKSVFTPYFKLQIKGKIFAFVGITSPKGFLGIAEKQLYGASLRNVNEVLPGIIDTLKSNTDYIILISGLTYPDNLRLMETHKEISLCISGGDSVGDLHSVKASRIDMDSGRSLITLMHPESYYLLTLTLGDQLTIQTIRQKKPTPQPTAGSTYRMFVKRLNLWKSKFTIQRQQIIAKDISGSITVDGTKVAEVLRHRFRSEVVMIEKNAVSPGVISGKVTYSDIITIVNNEFPIFTYKLTGAELKKIYTKQKANLIITGIKDEMVQRYPISSKREYLVCSTQSVYDSIIDQIDREVPYNNSWKTIADEIKTDLIQERVVSHISFEYLERRFRSLIDISLSNFFDQATVSRGLVQDIPPGKPSVSYSKWGMENEIDITLYNSRHNIVLTPYIYYIRQADDYLANLFRVTLFYTYNTAGIKPYHKSQVDSIVHTEDNINPHPLLFRETIGILVELDHLDGKIGIGFEKPARDPADDMIGGIETIIDTKIELFKATTYYLSLDSFFGFNQPDREKLRPDAQRIRAEVINTLRFKLNSFLSISAKHKWIYFDSPDYEKKYTDSQTILSLDMHADFKFF